MKTVISFLATLVLLAACATPPLQETAAAPTGNYVLDPTHARVNWSLSHAGLSNYTARFDTVSGALDFDAVAPENSRVDIRIDPKSISTGLPEFDETLSTDSRHFDSDTYPEIRFVSDTISITGETTGLITGMLTLRGITKPITLNTTFNGVGKSFGHPGKTLGFSATGDFLRSDFGMDYLIKLAGIGDKITLNIEAEFNEAQN